ncbi:hypothetical protein P3790_28890, partial [Pseudomonas aeruginosa]|nr:hypothetical protein [Pseudomonas aeruginosa]
MVWNPQQVTPQLVLKPVLNLSFDSTLGNNDASSDGLLSLIFSILTCHHHGMTFPRLLTTAPFGCSSTGWFEACSCKPTSEGLLPSSVQHHRSYDLCS